MSRFLQSGAVVLLGLWGLTTSEPLQNPSKGVSSRCAAVSAAMEAVPLGMCTFCIGLSGCPDYANLNCYCSTGECGMNTGTCISNAEDCPTGAKVGCFNAET